MNNHFLPQFLLKRWINEVTGKVTEYKRPYKSVKTKAKTPKYVGHAVDLYTQQGISEDIMHNIEHEYFRDIDQSGSDILNRIENGCIETLSLEERLSWSIFVLSLKQRTPRGVARLESIYETKYSEILEGFRDVYASRKKPSDPEDFDDFVASESTSSFFEARKKDVIKWGIALPDTLSTFSTMQWRVQTLEGDSDLLISDNAVVISDARIASTQRFIACPIGPRSLFIATHNEEDFKSITARQDLLARFNEVIVSNANEFVYGRDVRHLGLVERLLKARS